MISFKDLLPNSGNTAKLLAEDAGKYVGQVLMGTTGGKEASAWFTTHVGELTPMTRTMLSFVLRTMAYAPRQIAIMNLTRFFNLRPDVVAKVTHEGFDNLIETVLGLLGVPEADRGEEHNRLTACAKALEQHGDRKYAVLCRVHHGRGRHEIHATDCSTVRKPPPAPKPPPKPKKDKDGKEIPQEPPPPPAPVYVEGVRERTLAQILEIDPEFIELPPCCEYELPADVRTFINPPPMPPTPEPSKASEKKVGKRTLGDVLAEMRATANTPEERCARFYEDLMRVAERLTPLEDDCKAISKWGNKSAWSVQSFVSVLNRAIGIERDGTPTSAPGLPAEVRNWPQPVLALAVSSLKRIMEQHIGAHEDHEKAHEDHEPTAIALRAAEQVGNAMLLRGPACDKARIEVRTDAQQRHQSAAEERKRLRDLERLRYGR